MVVRLYQPFKIAPTPTVKTKSHRQARGPSPSPAPLPISADLPVAAIANSSPAESAAYRLLFKGLVGCSDALQSLRSNAEQTRCLQQWGRAARDQSAPDRLAPMDRLKRAEYDEIARRQAAYKERTLPNPIVPCKGAGSNFGLGCNAP